MLVSRLLLDLGRLLFAGLMLLVQLAGVLALGVAGATILDMAPQDRLASLWAGSHVLAGVALAILLAALVLRRTLRALLAPSGPKGHPAQSRGTRILLGLLAVTLGINITVLALSAYPTVKLAFDDFGPEVIDRLWDFWESLALIVLNCVVFTCIRNEGRFDDSEPPTSAPDADGKASVESGRSTIA